MTITTKTGRKIKTTQGLYRAVFDFTKKHKRVLMEDLWLFGQCAVEHMSNGKKRLIKPMSIIINKP